MKWLEDHNGITENPSGSNCDTRSDGIRASQDKCAGRDLAAQPAVVRRLVLPRPARR